MFSHDPMICSDTEIKTTKKCAYFLAAVVVVVVAVLALADFFDVCVRLARFFVSFLVVSPVKYEVMLVNNDESDQADFFVSTCRAGRLVTLSPVP